VNDPRLDLLAAVPSRSLTTAAFRQTDPKRQAFELDPKARYNERYHQKGDPWPAYCASGKLAAMLEQARHTYDEPLAEVFPTRLMSEIRVRGLDVLDLTNDQTLKDCGVKRAELTNDDLSFCQAIGGLARQRSDIHGILAPSAALPGGWILVIFREAFGVQAVVISSGLVRLAIEPQGP
jgi:RES domain-containing protein